MTTKLEKIPKTANRTFNIQCIYIGLNLKVVVELKWSLDDVLLNIYKLVVELVTGPTL